MRRAESPNLRAWATEFRTDTPMTAAVLAATRRLGSAYRSRGDVLRLALGFAVVSVGGVYLAARTIQWVAGNEAALAALGATALTAAATGLGALPALFVRQVSEAGRATMLGFSAGIMLAAAVLSLLVPAFEAATAFAGAGGAVALVAAGLAGGALAIRWADRSLPHQHLPATRVGSSARSAVLVAVAIALHNLPEGLAVGAATAGGSSSAVTLGIALQNMPEGLVVATALASLGVARLAAFGVAFATGLLEPVGGLIGASVAGGSAIALPWALAAAAGAMLFVVLHEMVPQLRSAGVRPALGALAGIAAMIALDAAVG
jgi:ZIP family zinc transporter